jgi:hypothetical protein
VRAEAVNWLHDLWFSYFWPSLQGNGPEALVQTVVYGAIALIFIPPVRRWMARHVESIKAHVSAEHQRLHDRLDEHQALLHHVIVNTKAIPNEVPGLPPDKQPKPPVKT